MMIGLDTNVLVRLVVGDDPQQTDQAKRFVNRRCTPNSPGFINCIVLAEFVWLLAGTYGYGRSEIATAIEGLLAGDDRVVEHHDEVRASLEDFKAGRADFADALIGHINRARGCEATATFDRKAAKLDSFIPVA
jgi:predicted nucleic-acid-binding protein